MIDIPTQKPYSEFNALVIDGQSLVRTQMRVALLDAGIENVQSAHNAYSALQLCETKRFDMILIAFNVKSDKDGFNILEEMKFKGYITKTTCVIFLSADTNVGLVNCVVEMEPTDFWVKPLEESKVKSRIHQIMLIEKKLYGLRYCFDKEEYPTAIYYAERQLKDESLALYHPHINRLIGRCLINLREYKEAHLLYQKLAETYNYAWVQVGLASTLLKLDMIDEATTLTDKLLQREDTKFATYDLLAEHHIDKEEYRKGYEIIQESTKLAPRNIERNKKLWNLARLNHDRKGQYLATKNMVRYARNSIHDSPTLTLNVIRAAIDLATSLPENESNRLINNAEKSIEQLTKDFGSVNELGDQLAIIKIRLLSLRKDKKAAEDSMKIHLHHESQRSFEHNLDKVKAFHEVGLWEQSVELLDQMKNDVNDVLTFRKNKNNSEFSKKSLLIEVEQRNFEDNLDKVKALHEVAMWEQSILLLERMKNEVKHDSFTGKVLAEYLEQEFEERKDIRYSPKELSEMAASHYKNKRYKPAYDLLFQAALLSPNNVNITINVLKVIAILAEESKLSDKENKSVKHCVAALTGISLSKTQQKKLDEYNERIEIAIALQE